MTHILRAAVAAFAAMICAVAAGVVATPPVASAVECATDCLQLSFDKAVSNDYRTAPVYPGGTSISITASYTTAIARASNVHVGISLSRLETVNGQLAWVRQATPDVSANGLPTATATASTGALGEGLYQINTDATVTYTEVDGGYPLYSGGNEWRYVQIDATAPGVTVEKWYTQDDPTGLTPIRFVATFTEPVTGLSASDIVLGGTAGATTAVVAPTSETGNIYAISVSGMTQSGTVTASIGANSAQDVVGYGNTASSSIDNSVAWQAPADTTAPDVTVEQAVGQADPAAGGDVLFTATFSEPVTGLTAEDVVLGGTAGATTVTITGSGTTYTLAVSGMTTSGTVTAALVLGAASDASGNSNGPSTSTDNAVSWSPVDQDQPAPGGGSTSSPATQAVVSSPVSGQASEEQSQPQSQSPEVTPANETTSTTAPVVPTITRQTARISGARDRVVTVDERRVLTKRAVITNAGVTVRWRPAKASRPVCRIDREAGTVTVEFRQRGRCTVVAWAPAPSATWTVYRTVRTYIVR